MERVQQFVVLFVVVIDEHSELYTHVRNILKNDYSTLKILKKLKRYTLQFQIIVPIRLLIFVFLPEHPPPPPLGV